MALPHVQVPGISVAIALRMHYLDEGPAAAAPILMLHAEPSWSYLFDAWSRTHKEAIDDYLQALRSEPGSGVWLMGLGISLRADNRGAEARDALGRALASNTLSPDLRAYVEQQLRQLRP